MRPPGPVPLTFVRAISFSAAILRARGEALIRSVSGCGFRAGAAFFVGFSLAAFVSPATCFASAGSASSSPRYSSPSSISFVSERSSSLSGASATSLPAFLPFSFSSPSSWAFSPSSAGASSPSSPMNAIRSPTFTFPPSSHVDFLQDAVVGRFPFHRRLVGLDLGQHFAGSHLIADFLLPAHQCPFGHGIAQFRHLNFRHGGK